MNKIKTLTVLIVAIYLILLGVFIFLNIPKIDSNQNLKTDDDTDTTNENNTDNETMYIKTIYGNTSADIKLEFFITNGDCSSCDEIKEYLFEDILPKYGDEVYIYQYPVDFSEELKNNYLLFRSYKLKNTPGLLIINTSKSDADEYLITLEYSQINRYNNTIEKAIEYHLFENYSNDLNISDTKYIYETFFGTIDLSTMTLPVITIILGAIDSVNPCSFFILLFLLSILLYTRSRKRMILIGSIFIFFSGFIYFLMMVLLLEALEAFQLTGQQIYITYIAGIIAIIFGILNIKDFFFFKKGPTASISESSKSKLFKQMRKIVKITSIPALIAATIILAISANTVELLCSLNLPIVYNAILISYSLGSAQNYMYILLYNVIYIIPLLVITGTVVVTLGKRKLNELQGRMLKLFSGIMIFSFGEIMLINYNFLSNMFSAIWLLVLSILITTVVYIITKIFETRSTQENTTT